MKVRQIPQTNTPNEFNRIVTADASDRVRQLSSILRDKGLITAAEAAGPYVSSAPSTFLAPAAEPVTTAPGMAAGQPHKPGSDPTRKLVDSLNSTELSDSQQHCRPLPPGSRLHALIEANL